MPRKFLNDSDVLRHKSDTCLSKQPVRKSPEEVGAKLSPLQILREMFVDEKSLVGIVQGG